MRYIVVHQMTGRTLFVAATVEACEAFIAAHGLRGQVYIK